MKNLFKIFACLMMAIAIPFTSCTEEPEESTGSVTGHVTVAPGGTEPLAGVTVAILSSGQSTTTGSDGAFVFHNLQPGSYSLQFSKSGYTTNSRSVTVTAGLETKCDIQLSRENEEADITINPSSLNFGTTQTDMSVTIKNNGNATAQWAIELGNNPWLSASQLGGSIQAGRTQSITFSVDRNFLSETRSIVVNLQAFGNSYPINISCAPRNTSSQMVIEPTVLNFGATSTQQTFNIRNTGTATLTWTASGINTPALTLSAMQGTVAAGGKTAVIATIDREKVSGELVTTFIISDGVREETVTVNVNNNGGSTPDNPGGNGGVTGDIVVTNGLYAYFPFNGNFKDFSGNDIFGYGSPDPTFADDGVVAGTKAAKFSRTEKSAFIVNEGLIDSRKMSVCFWIKGIAEGNIFYVTSNTANADPMMKFVYRDNHFKYIITRYHISNQFDVTGNFSHKDVTDGGWHHIAIVSSTPDGNYVDSTTQLYIDGRLMDSVTENLSGDANTHFGAGTKFILGGDGVPNIQIADLRIYDTRAISAAEVKTIYEAKQ